MSDGVSTLLHSVLPFVSDTAWNYVLYDFLLPGFSTLIGLGFAKVFGWKPSKSQTFGFCGLLFFAALLAIFVFRSAFPTSSDTQALILNHPDLHGEILNLAPVNGAKVTGYILPFPLSGAPTLVELRIVNGGSPSVVWNWDLRVTLVSGQNIETRECGEYLPMNGNIASMGGSSGVQFTADSYLPNTLGQSPLGEGAAKVGFVEFFFKNGASFDELCRPGVKYTVECEDADGKITSIDYTIPAGGLSQQ
jgi:hypothetical protein